MKPEEQAIIFEKIKAASAKRLDGQLQRLAARSNTALSGAGLHAEDEMNPLQSMLTLALVEKWDVTRFLDEVYVLSIDPENGPESFDNAIRAAWQAAGQTFDCASLLSGLITSYDAAVKGEKA